MDAGTGQVVASLLTTQDVDDGSRAGLLLDQVEGHLASFAGDGAYDPDGVTASVAARHAEAAISRFKQVIGDGPRLHTDERQATEVEVAVHVLNRMLELGRPNFVRIA